MAELQWSWLGTVPYAAARAQQETFASAVARGEAPEALFLLEHPPVFTLGRHREASAQAVVCQDFWFYRGLLDAAAVGSGPRVGVALLAPWAFLGLLCFLWVDWRKGMRQAGRAELPRDHRWWKAMPVKLLDDIPAKETEIPPA